MRSLEKPYRTSGETRASSRDQNFGLPSNVPELIFHKAGTCIENQEPVKSVALSWTSTCVPGKNVQALKKNGIKMKINRIIKMENIWNYWMSDMALSNRIDRSQRIPRCVNRAIIVAIIPIIIGNSMSHFFCGRYTTIPYSQRE